MIRWLSLSDYAVIGVAEASVAIIVALLVLGIEEGLTREIAFTSDHDDQTDLISAVIAFRLRFCGLAVAVMILVGLVSRYLLADPRIAVAVWCCVPLVVIQMLHSLAYASLAGLGRYGGLLSMQVIQSLVRLGLILLLVPFCGLWGYFVAQTVERLPLLLFSLPHLITALCRLDLGVSSLSSQFETLSRLREISSLNYFNHLTTEIWQRLPIFVGAIFLPAHVIGAVTIAQSLGRRLSVVNQSLSTFQVARMSSALRDGVQSFTNAVRRELWVVITCNVLAACAACIAWLCIGAQVVGAEKYESVGGLVYAFIAFQLMHAITNVTKRSIIVPTKKTQGLVSLVVSLRTLTFLILPNSYPLGDGLTLDNPHFTVLSCRTNRHDVHVTRVQSRQRASGKVEDCPRCTNPNTSVPRCRLV